MGFKPFKIAAIAEAVIQSNDYDLEIDPKIHPLDIAKQWSGEFFSNATITTYSLVHIVQCDWKDGISQEIYYCADHQNQ